MCPNILSIDMIKEIGKYCDDLSYLQLLKTSKYYYTNVDPAQQKVLRTALINKKYFKTKRQHVSFCLPASDLFPTYLVHKINVQLDFEIIGMQSPCLKRPKNLLTD